MKVAGSQLMDRIEVSPLEAEEWELLTPMWSAGLIECACRHLAAGTHDDGWIMQSPCDAPH